MRRFAKDSTAKRTDNVTGIKVISYVVNLLVIELMFCKRMLPLLKKNGHIGFFIFLAGMFAVLSGCNQTPVTQDSPSAPEAPLRQPFDYHQPDPSAKVIQMQSSRWIPAAWADLPGWQEDSIGEAWQAWVQSCSQFSALWVNQCGQILHLVNASETVKRQWMYDHLQPYHIKSLQGETSGLLTAYYEPIFRARREAVGAFQYPLYYAPENLHPTQPYWTRNEIESLPRAQRELENYHFAYLDNPLDVLILHIQGSGQLILTEPDGITHTIRAAFAASNNHRYQSVGRYLLNKKLITDGTWDGIRAWLEQNPHRINEVLWTNPRYIFFREQEINSPFLGPDRKSVV